MRVFLIVVSLAVAAGCGHATKIRPTPRAQLDLEASAGGPFAKVGPVHVPVPLTTVGASYGVRDRLDVSGHLHATAAVFGVAGLDVGASYLLFEEDRAVPAVTVASRLYGFTDFQSGFRPYLEASVAGSYLFGETFLTYLGVTGFAQFAGAPPLWALSVGEEFQLGKAGLGVELRWYQPSRGTQYDVVDWLGVAGQGGLGAVFSFRYRFGGAL